MEESACLMHAFSYVSGICHEAKEGNPMHSLGESISFGRFMSESLSWEKWSSFSNNRYVEEAERYARPGSVAQKKAFFEAHYKRIAAKKAAALLEQANAAENNAPEAEYEGCVDNAAAKFSQTPISDSNVAVEEQQEVKAIDSEADFRVDSNGYNPNVEMNVLESSKVMAGLGADPVTKDQVLVENPTKIESSDKVGDAENHNKGTELELSRTTQMEKPLLKKNPDPNQEVLASVTKKKPTTPSTKPSVYSRAHKLPSSPTKPTAPFHPRKENIATPISRKPATESSDKKRSTPLSHHLSINIASAREPTKLSNPVVRKIETSRGGTSFSKASKDCSTPLRTPTRAPINGASKHPSATPSSENRRVRTPGDPLASGSRTTGSKCRFLPTYCTDPLSALRNKSQSPNFSTSFNLRTEERAARRKKLEERFNAKETEKVQLQTKIKEKAESELRKLRQTLCFKARPLPDFYKERETLKGQTKKIPATHHESPKPGRKPTTSAVHPQSPKPGRKLTTSTVQGPKPLPPQWPCIKSSGSKHVAEKINQAPNTPLISVRVITTHENRSPNIQH